MLQRQGRDTSFAAPQAGSTIQFWAAPDGCKCFAFAHNWFPRYALYVDGARVDWETAQDFELFDGYRIDVEWQAFLAFLLHDVLVRYPVYERYPGGAAFGWYKGTMGRTGAWEWCSEAPPAHEIIFPPRPSNAAVVEWWTKLDEYVRRVRELFNRRQQGSFHAWWQTLRRELAGLWEAADLGQKNWRIRRYRSSRSAD